MTLHWVIAGGGTGGHVTPALALGEVIRGAGERVRFLGTRRGIETRLVPDAGFELVALDARPVVGRSLIGRARALLSLAGASLAARRELRSFGADLVVAVGGYASVPAALAAWTTRTPVVLVNTDATPGLANRLLARWARRIFVGFESAAAPLRRGPSDQRVRVSGVPLREGLRRQFARSAKSGERARSGGPLHLFVFGGSQGARQINEAMMEAAPHLEPEAILIVHQTGESDRDRVERAYRAAGFDAEVIVFERNMPARYQWADLVLCRAGAISIAELALAGRPAVLVPLTHVGGGEQSANARELERAGGAVVLDSRDLCAQQLIDALRELCGDRSRLERMSAGAASLARPDAAEMIVSDCRALLEGGRGEGAP